MNALCNDVNRIAKFTVLKLLYHFYLCCMIVEIDIVNHNKHNTILTVVLYDQT